MVDKLTQPELTDRTSEEKLESLLARLQAIARRNEDSFAYSIDICPTAKSARFSFYCFEDYDKHSFVAGEGATLLEAIEAANNNIPDALVHWDYKE